MDKNPLFNYDPKTHYIGTSPLGFMRPINAPSSSLKPIVSAPFDTKMKAYDLTPQYTPVYTQIPHEYLNFVDKKVSYAYDKILF